MSLSDHLHAFRTLQVPPQGKGALYLRPLLMGSGPILGLAPAPEYTFLIYAAPVGNYFKVSATLVPVQQSPAAGNETRMTDPRRRDLD